MGGRSGYGRDPVPERWGKIHAPQSQGTNATSATMGMHLFHVSFHRARGARPLMALLWALAGLSLQAGSAWH